MGYILRKEFSEIQKVEDNFFLRNKGVIYIFSKKYGCHTYIDRKAVQYEYFFGTVVEDIAFGTEMLPVVRRTVQPLAH